MEGPIPEKYLDVRQYKLAGYTSSEKPEFADAECQTFVSTKNSSANGYTLKMDYFNTTTNSSQIFESNFMERPNNSGQYVWVDGNGTIILDSASSVVIVHEDLIVEAGCQKIDNNPENCSYWWILYGPDKVLKDWDVIKQKISDIGLSTENVTFYKQKDCN